VLAATTGNTATDLAVEALTFASQFDVGAIERVMNNLLYAYLQRGELARGIAALPRALGFAKQNPSILHNAACLLTRAGDHARAIECVRDAKQHGYDKLEALRADEDLAPLRELTEFRAIWE
jgi:Flp pilus assembly protein TadD